MNSLNSEGALSVPSQYWPWLAVAMILGIIIGWMVCDYVEQTR